MDDLSQQKRLECFEAKTLDDLYSIGDRLHDEPFDVDSIRFDEHTGVLEIPFQRIFHEGPQHIIKQRLAYRVVEVDILRGILRFFNVISYELDDRANIGENPFNYFEYDPTRQVLTLIFCCDCELKLRVNAVHAEYREIEYRGKSKITQGLFWDMNRGAAYND